MRARWPIGVFVAVEIAFTAAYYAVDSAWGRAAYWGAIGLTGVAAMLIGIGRNRPAHRREWRLLALGAFLLGLGDTTSLVLRARGSADPQPLPVDLCYLAMFVAIMAGVIGLSRSGVRERDRAGLLDAVTLAIAGGLLFWIYLIAPRIGPGQSLLDLLNVVGYPLGMLLMVSMVVRLGAGTYASPALVLFSGGLYALGIGEITFLLTALSGSWHPGGAADLWWVAFYLGWGSAALHPSMTRLGELRLARSGDLTPQRLFLLALCAVIPSLVIITMAIRGTAHYVGVIGGAGLLMVALVLARLYGVLRRQWSALSQERALRRAGAALLAATDTDAIQQAVDRAVGRLLNGEPHRTTLDLDTSPPPGPTVTINPADSAAEAVATCRLSAGSEDLGALLVTAAPNRLDRLTGALEILAAQTSLAVTRIRLTDAVAQREAEVYFQNLVYHSSDVILIVDDAGVIRFRSPSAEPTFGDQTAVGRIIMDLVPESERAHAADLMGRLAAGDDAVPNDLEWHMHSRIGQPLLIAASWRDLRSDPTVRGFVITLRDVTERRRLEDELTYRAFHDPLTGLPNREHFGIEVEKAVRHASAEATITGVLYLDLDDFKSINDSHGHLVGDQVLREMATRITQAVRKNDVAARLGGDEFAVLVPGATSVHQIESVAERVVQALSVPMRVGSRTLALSGSLGVTTTADSDPAALLRDADRALYLAKQNGKGRWHRHVPDQASEPYR